MIRTLILFLLIACSGCFGYLHYVTGQTAKPLAKLISPVFEAAQMNLGEDFWLPKVASVSAAEDTNTVDPQAPIISAKAALFIDTHTGQVLYQKNIHQRLHIASLTKIMTVIIAMENEQSSSSSKKLDKLYTVSAQAAGMEPDHMELRTGEKLTLEELLDGVFTISANDAAEVLAEESVGSRDEFINLMNEQAEQIGMNDTHFINPTGLEEDGKEQYSSAYDVALMARYAISHWPHLVDISSKPFIYLPATSTHQDYTLTSGINLLTTYPGVVGFKTGYTPEAGYTLVTLCRKNGHEVLGVILNSDDRRGEARELLDYAFSKLQA